jgi:hypothetical protein
MLAFAPVPVARDPTQPVQPSAACVRRGESELLMKFSVALVVVLTALSACGEDLAGNYVLRGVMEMGSELTLKQDGQFEFILAYGAADYWSKGTWRQEGHAVILHSTGKKEDPFKLLRSEAGAPGQIRVLVLGQNGRGVPNIHVRLTGGEHPQEASTDSDGAAIFPDDPKASGISFEVRVYQLNAGPFPMKAGHREYDFEINGDAVMQVLFQDEKLAIDGTTLIVTHWGEEHPMRYEKE